MIHVLGIIALIGCIAWALGYFIPMPEKMKMGIYVIASIFTLLYCLHYLEPLLPKALR